MALDEKRALDEILVRVGSQTNGGRDGVSIRYRTWIEKDGVEMAGTSNLEGPVSTDWSNPEVTERIGVTAASLQKQVNELLAEISETREKLEEARRELDNHHA